MTSAGRKQERKWQDGQPQPCVLHGFKKPTEIQRLSTTEKNMLFSFLLHNILMPRKTTELSSGTSA